MARRTNGTNGAASRDERANGSATVEVAPGAPDTGGVPPPVQPVSVKRRKSTPDGELLERAVRSARDPLTRPAARKPAKKLVVKGVRKAKGSRVEDVEDRPRRRAKPTESVHDGESSSGFDSRDERAIASEVAERIRALLMELGLDKVLGGASPREMASGLAGWLAQLVPTAREHALGSLKNLLASEYLQPDTWKGLLYVAQNAVESARDARARRARGDYETDDFGFDEEFFQACIPVTRFLHEKWWRVDVTGLENVPDDKRSLIVANHSGVLPFDGAMISQSIWSQHRSPRPVRWLYLKWFASLPFVSILLSRAGGAMACPENGERLLEQDRLVGVFPEGLKGVGKLFRDRYKLARFGRGGFIKMAMRTKSPIIPVSVVGAEETYPALTYLEFISKPLGIPMLPITPTFPWLGLLGLVPLPSKWSIHFGTPIRFNENAPGKVDDFLILSLLTEKVRGQIQAQINDQLKLRKSVFFG